MKTFRQLLEDIQVGPAPEEISYKGYTTKNLHHVPDATKAFQATITRVQKGTLEDKGEVLAALKATDTYMRLNDMHLEQEKDLDSQELDQWLASHEEAKSALTKIGEFEHHYDYWNSHNAELQYLKANQNMPQEAESVQIEEGPYSSGQLKASPEQLKQANKVPSGGRTTTIVDRDAKGVYTLTMKDGKEVSKVYKESTEIGEASKLQGTPVVSLSDFGSKDNTKNKYGQTVPKKLKPNDPRVKMYTEPKKEGVAEGLHNDYVFQKVQSGYWGSTPLDTKVVVKAASEAEARAKIRQRKDFVKKLRNGDTVSWRLAEGLADDFLAMAKNRNPNARIVTAVQKRKEAEELMKKREASGTKPAHAAPTSNPRPLGGHDPKSGRSYSESVEPIDELSKTTLGSYIKKRSHDVATQGAMTRQHAVDAAKEKEAQGGYTTSSVRDKEQKADKAFMKGWKQRMNIAKAVDRLTKEEVEETEQIDEISAELKQKYLAAATKKHLQQFLGRAPVRDKQELDKRRAAIQKTSKELTGKTHYQEEAEGVAESLHNDYVFHRVQSGYWGSTHLDKKVVVKAASKDEAHAKIRQRKDFVKKLRNGDTVSWRLKEEVEIDEALDFKKEAAKHMKDMHDKNATPANKAYAQKMLQRALEASKMKDKVAATKHYMGEEVSEQKSSLPPHLQKLIKDKQLDKKPMTMVTPSQKEKLKATVKDVTPKGYGPNEEVELDEVMEGQLRNFSPHSDLAGRGRLSGYNKTAAGKKREADRETERLKDKMKFTKSQGGIAGPKGKLPEQVELDENYRALALKGIGAEGKGDIKVGHGVDYYHPKTGDKHMGKIVSMSDKGYVVKDDKTGVRHSFDYFRREQVELGEKTLTPAELKKREEVAKAMERKNPNMDMSRKMAIATAVAKRVAEQYDDAE